MSASAAIAESLLRRAFGGQARRSLFRRTVGDWRPSFWRLSPSEERDRHRRRRRSQSPELRMPVSFGDSGVSSRRFTFHLSRLTRIKKRGMMVCVLLRHGIAVEREEWEGPDADRPLTEKGKKRVREMAAGLNWLDVQPTHVWSSPLIRAIETAKIAHRSLRVRSAVHIVDALLPDAPPDRLLSILHDLPPESRVLCVGHEPHLGIVASVMLAGKPSTAFPFKKAGACLIEMSIPVKPGQGVLRWWLPPSQLRDIGKRKTGKAEGVSG